MEWCFSMYFSFSFSVVVLFLLVLLGIRLFCYRKALELKPYTSTQIPESPNPKVGGSRVGKRRKLCSRSKTHTHTHQKNKYLD